MTGDQITRPRLALAALWLLCAFAAPASEPPTRKPLEEKGKTEKVESATTVQVESPIVRVNVTPMDSDGNMVTGLTEENFTVYDRGAPVKIENFFPDASPVNVVLLMEASRQIEGLENDYWYAALDFMKNLREDDYVALVAFDIKPTIAVDFTQDKNKISREVNMRLYFKGFSDSCLGDAVAFALDRMADVEGKKAVVLLSTGLDTFSKLTYDKVISRLAESETVIYAVSMGQLARTLNDGYYPDDLRSDLLMADLRLKSFAQKTGGAAFFPRFTTEFPSVFKNINIMLRHQYTLAFRPASPPDGKFKKIKVEAVADLKHDGKPVKLKVRHREGYRLPAP